MQRSEIDAIPLEGDLSFRQRAVEPDRTALLLIDLQKGEYNPDKIAAEPQHAYLFERIREVVIPNGQKLLAACRAAGVEVIYTVVESLTLDGRDRSLDYKVSGIFFPKGSWGAEVLDELKPLPNEIVIPKTSSSLFNSTNFEYVLRNLRVEYVMVMGILTDQCVETAVRDGCDRGFMMTLVDDACATVLRAAAQGSADRLQGLLPDPHDRPGDRGAAAPGRRQSGCLKRQQDRALRAFTAARSDAIGEGCPGGPAKEQPVHARRLARPRILACILPRWVDNEPRTATSRSHPGPGGKENEASAELYGRAVARRTRGARRAGERGDPDRRRDLHDRAPGAAG